MTHLCPLGHRVHRIKSDGRGHCGTCEHIYPPRMLIPLVGKVGKRNYELYARAYRLGFQRAMSLDDVAS